jgi:hypothetical protein
MFHYVKPISHRKAQVPQGAEMGTRNQGGLFEGPDALPAYSLYSILPLQGPLMELHLHPPWNIPIAPERLHCLVVVAWA